MVNSDMPVGRQNFTICHELYHLYVQEHFETRVCKVGSFDKKDPEEYNADTFAAHFLLPAEALKTRIPLQELEHRNVSLATILRIENLFESSREFLLIRLQELGFIHEEEKEQFQKSVRATAHRYGYSPYLYTKSAAESVVGDYASLANELFDSELISESHYYSVMEDLGFNLSDIDLQEMKQNEKLILIDADVNNQTSFQDFLSRYLSRKAKTPFLITETAFCAEGGTRTRTGLLPHAPETCVSTSFTTSA